MPSSEWSRCRTVWGAREQHKSAYMVRHSVKPLCPLANLFGGCFCLGSGPFCKSGLLFLLTKRKSGLEICGSSGWFVGCLVCMICPHFGTFFGPCTKWRFTAYAHVRTEPQCDIGHTRGKKKSAQAVSGLGQASVSLGVPRMPTNLLHHGHKTWLR